MLLVFIIGWILYKVCFVVIKGKIWLFFKVVIVVVILGVICDVLFNKVLFKLKKVIVFILFIF